MKTVAELSCLLDERKTDPVELAEEALSAAGANQERTNAYITLCPDIARAEAKEAAERLRKGERRGPLDGIPYAVKDLIYAKGVPCTGGSKQLKDFIPDEDGAMVAAMRRAGAVFTGKTNTQEWGCGPTGEQSYFGPARNPADPSRITGGSSSGSAAAIACGAVPCALGTDAGGSIRIPAALCGVTGLKPSFALVDCSGSLSGSIHLGVGGPMAADPEDCAILMDALTGSDAYRAAILEDGSLKSKRITVPRNLFADCVEDGVAESFEAAVRTLKDAGASVEDIPIPWLEDIPELSSAITFPEIAYLHRERLQSDPDGYRPAIKARIERGFDYPAVKYIEAMERREKLIRQWESFMADKDAVMMPTVPITAYPLFLESMVLCGKERNCSELLVKHTRAANVIGCPALSVPGRPVGALPVGIMFSGATGKDAELLRLGHLFGQAQKKKI